MGGILTNWVTVRTSLLQLHRIERDQKKGIWADLQKKDLSLLRKRLRRLDLYFGGLKGICSQPGVVIIVGQNDELIAVKECRKLGICIISRLDTDCDPRLVEIGVPLNDDSTSRIHLFVFRLVSRIQDGRFWWYSKN